MQTPLLDKWNSADEVEKRRLLNEAKWETDKLEAILSHSKQYGIYYGQETNPYKTQGGLQ